MSRQPPRTGSSPSAARSFAFAAIAASQSLFASASSASLIFGAASWSAATAAFETSTGFSSCAAGGRSPHATSAAAASIASTTRRLTSGIQLREDLADAEQVVDERQERHSGDEEHREIRVARDVGESQAE